LLQSVNEVLQLVKGVLQLVNEVLQLVNEVLQFAAKVPLFYFGVLPIARNGRFFSLSCVFWAIAKRATARVALTLLITADCGSDTPHSLL
jgi:hypothetical protein